MLECVDPQLPLLAVLGKEGIVSFASAQQELRSEGNIFDVPMLTLGEVKVQQFDF